MKGDSLAVLEYHWYDPFENPDCIGRVNYYGIPAIPWPICDGRYVEVNADSETFNTYLSAYQTEMSCFSPCDLNLQVDYDSTSRFLKVKSKVWAIDTLSNAHLRYAIAESHIYHRWHLDSLHHVVRKMLPDYNGTAFGINPGEIFVDSQTYTLSSTWNDKNCYVVVFVQRDDLDRTVLRSAKSNLTWIFGDANGDGVTDVEDIAYLIDYLFGHGPYPLNTNGSGDPNSDCIVNVADIVYLINYVFVGGPEPLKGCAW